MSYSGYGAPNYPPAGGAYGASGYGSAPPHRGSYGSSYGGAAAPPPPARGSYGSGASYGGTPGYGSPASSYGAPGYAGGAAAGNTYASAGYSRPRPPTTYIDPTIRNWFETVDRNKSGQIDAQELQMALVNGDYSNFDLDTTKMLIGIFDVDKTGTISIEEFAGVFKYINDWRNVFQHFDADRSGSIEGHELANALAQFGYRLSPFTLRVLEDKYGEYPIHRRGLWLTFTASSSSHFFFLISFIFTLFSNVFIFSISNLISSLINILLLMLFTYIMYDLVNSGNPNMNRGGRYGGVGVQGISFDRFIRVCVAVKTLSENFQRLDVHKSGYVNMDYELFLQSALAAP